MSSPRATVLIVDDSPIFVEALRQVLESDPRLSVAGHASDGAEAVAAVERLRPDVVTMDLHMPTLGGIDAIAEIMSVRPTPILVMTGDPRAEERGLCFDAFSHGALDLVPKPSMSDDSARAALCDRIHLLSTVSVVPRRRKRSAPVGSVVAPRFSGASPEVLGIVASTGGPRALSRLLSSLPADMPFGIVIVQHLFRGFTEHLVSWLRVASKLSVRMAEHDAVVDPGTVWLAPDDRHVRVLSGRRLEVDDGPPITGHRPSGDALLSSIAENLGPRGMGVVLTGMGRDGAEGLLKLKQTGAMTFAQDAASSAVDGMPKAARDLDAARHVVALDDLAAVLLQNAVGRRRFAPP